MTEYKPSAFQKLRESINHYARTSVAIGIMNRILDSATEKYKDNLGMQARIEEIKHSIKMGNYESAASETEKLLELNPVEEFSGKKTLVEIVNGLSKEDIEKFGGLWK